MINNRISIVLDPQDVADFKAALNTIIRILHKWLAGINLDKIPSGSYMGEGEGWKYCQDGHSFAQECPKAYDDEVFLPEEHTKDYHAAEFLIEAKNAVRQISTLTTTVFNLVGMDLMEQTNYLRSRAEEKRNVNPTYMKWYNTLKSFVETRVIKAAETTKAKEELAKANEELTKAKEQLAAMTKNG
jgi:hypothetical protein